MILLLLEKEHLHKIFSRKSYGKYSTKNTIIDIWNRIPLNIKCSASLKIFKKKLKRFRLSHVVIAKQVLRYIHSKIFLIYE